MKTILAAWLSLFAADARAQAPADPAAPENICAFSIRPFQTSELQFLTKQGLDPSAREASLTVCKRRVTLEMRALKSDLERHPGLDPAAARRYKAAIRFAAPADKDRRLLEERIVSMLAGLLAPRVPELKEGRYSEGEKIWLGALSEQLRAQVLAQAERLHDNPPAGGARPAPAPPRGAAPAGRPAACEAEICEDYRKWGCKPPLERSSDRNCRGLKELMSGCVCK